MSTKQPAPGPGAQARMGAFCSFETLLGLNSFSTQRAFAAKMGWTTTRVCDLCRGRMPNRDVIEAIARELRVTPEFVLGTIVRSSEEGGYRLAHAMGVALAFRDLRVEHARAILGALP